MTIALFDKFLNTLPQAVLEAKDISMVIMIDPPEGLPPPLLAGRGILSTEAKTIDVYNAEGSAVEHTFDISGTDLTPITEELEAVKATANTADDLSKDNKQRLDAIDLSKYAELDKDVQFNVLNLTSKLNLTDPSGSEVNFTDALKFNNSGFTKLSILNGSIDVNTQISMGGTHQIINLASGGDNDTNAATIGDAKRISTEGSGLKPTEGEWDMLSLPITNVATSEVETSAATVGQINAVEGKADAAQTTATAADTLSKANEQKINNLPAPPDLSNYIQNGDDAELTSVAFTEASSIHFRPESGLILESDSICGEDTSGNKTFILKDGEFDLKTKVITNVSDGVGDTDAVTKGQLNVVEGKVDTNTSSISGIKSTADAADALSKQNKTTLDNLPPDPTSRVAALEANSLQKNESGFDAKSFKILNLDSGEDVDTSAATIGDVKRISTSGSGLKPVDETWDMLGYTVLNVGTSEEVTSAANVGQVNAVKTVADAADTLSKENATRIDNLPPPPDLSGYVKNGDDVNFGTAEINIAKITKGDDSTKFSDILIDGNTNTQLNFVGDTHFFIRDKTDNSKGLEAFQVDSSARFIAKQKIKTPIITNTYTGTTNSNTDKAGFIDFSEEGVINLGAKSKVSFNVAGNGIIEAAASGLKLLRDADANNHSISKMGDLKFSSGYQVEGGATGDLKVRNVEGIYKDSSTDNSSIRFEGDDAKYKAAHHMYHTNDGSSQIFGISTAGANLFNHNIIKVKHITANSAGSMNVAGVKLLKRDDGQDAQQSIQLNASDITSYSDKHEWKTNENARRLTIENHKADWHDCQLNNIADAVDDKDVPNLAQVKSLVTEEWFEVAHGNLASDGNRPTGGSSDSNLNVWHTSVAESTTNPNNEFKISFNGAYGKVKDWTYPLRYKLVQGDKVQYWKVGDNGWETGTNVWHLSAESVEGDDLATGTDTVVYASAYMVDSGGDSPQEMDGFKKYITTSTAVTYYEHQGDSHLYIDWTGNGGVISLDTMRNGTDQQEDIFMLHNKTDTEMSVRFFFNGSSVTQVVAARSFIQGWANRDLGRWVIGTYKDPSFVPEQLVIKATDLSWSTSSDPRVNTQRMIAAAPEMCTIIGIHKSNGSAKEKIVSVGDSNRVETQTSSFVVNKNSSTHATGICTSEESSGKTWSRILDGSRGAWFTNESANSRMASVDIDPSEYPEEQIFFTTDQGIMETYVDEVDGEIKLRPLEGYNVPKNEADIAALEVQTEKNRSVTHYFINEGTLSYDWPDETRRPLVEVGVLNTTQTINNSSVTVTDNDTHRYSGNYNTVGSIAINSSGDWTNQYTYHNCYKHVSESYYVVFNQGNASWQIIESANPHTSTGSQAASVTVQLGGQTSLPESFGNYTIDPNFDNIDSLEFLTAEVPIQYDDVNSRVIINFNGAKPSGYVVLK